MNQKNKKVDFFGMLSGTLRGSLSGNLLTGKGKIRAGEGTIGEGLDFQCRLNL